MSSPTRRTRPAGSRSYATGAWSTCSRPTRCWLQASLPEYSAICSCSYVLSPRASAISSFASAKRSSSSVRASSATTWTLSDNGGSGSGSAFQMQQPVIGRRRRSRLVEFGRLCMLETPPDTRSTLAAAEGSLRIRHRDHQRHGIDRGLDKAVALVEPLRLRGDRVHENGTDSAELGGLQDSENCIAQ